MSNAYLEYIEEFSIEIADYNPISPTSHMPLPETIPKRNNGALHLVKVYPERNPHRLYEENNPDISLCIYEWHNQNKYLEFCYITERRSDEYKQVNLLVIMGKDRSHYCIIKDLHKLVYNHSKHKGRKYLCRYCLHVYSSEKGYNEHLTKKCKGLNNAPQIPKVPILEKSIKAFSNHKCMQPNSYRIIWDLECLTTNLTPEEKTQLTRTEKLQRHIPCGYSYVVVRMDSFGNYEIVSYDLYKGPNALEKFVDKLEIELAEIQADLSSPAEIIMEPGDYILFNEAIECHICEKPFIDPAPEILQQFEKAKYQLLECKEWEAYMKKDHSKKKDVQKKYQQVLSNLNHKVDPEEVPDIQSIAPDAKIGYMSEVDLEVLIYLQDFFADYPLALKKQIVTKNWLSLYNKRLVHDKEVG
ncbi:18104_t:CDS:2, partial [Gigaspora margarita]